MGLEDVHSIDERGFPIPARTSCRGITSTFFVLDASSCSTNTGLVQVSSSRRA
jgi:hypothetical protein